MPDDLVLMTEIGDGYEFQQRTPREELFSMTRSCRAFIGGIERQSPAPVILEPEAFGSRRQRQHRIGI